MFDQLCPPDSSRARRKLCVVLVTNNIPEHEPKREAMRSFIRESSFPPERFRFMYLFQEKQPEFVKALTLGDIHTSRPSSSGPLSDSSSSSTYGSSSETAGAGTESDPDLISRSTKPKHLDANTLDVVVLWRKEHDRVLYEWLPSGWDVTDEDRANSTKQLLSQLLFKLSQTTENFPHDVKVVELIDEQAKGLFGRIVKKLLIMTDSLSENITRKEVLPFISVVLSVGFIVLIGYVMSHLV